MAKISNTLVGLINFVTLLISFPMIVTAVQFHVQAATECERFFQLPLLIVGVILFVASVLGFMGACSRVSIFLWLYLIMIFLMIVAIFGITVATFIVTNKGVGQALSGKGYKEYRLGDYSHWLQKRVREWENWQVIEGCLIEARLCRRFSHELVGMSAYEFYKQDLSPIQSGCCKPPAYCKFKYVNATYWTVPGNGPAPSSSPDCKAWSNEQEKLCYSCNSCKAGVLETLKDGWKKIAIFNVVLLVVLIVTYSFGCCALRNNNKSNYQMGGGNP